MGFEYCWGVVYLLRDNVCQWLAAGWWFFPGTPVSSTNKTDRHYITEILLNTITPVVKICIKLHILTLPVRYKSHCYIIFILIIKCPSLYTIFILWNLNICCSAWTYSFSRSFFPIIDFVRLYLITLTNILYRNKSWLYRYVYVFLLCRMF
jgi:hypothetical protein